MVRDKLRIRFSKSGDLRLVSHHDLMRCFERMLRRADLPVRSTQGFHPKPRLIFALSLGLGIVGQQEVVELELTEVIDPDEIRDRLQKQAPAGLVIRSVCRIPAKASAQVRRIVYRIALNPDQQAEVSGPIDRILNSTEVWIDRTRPQARRVDIRPSIHHLRAHAGFLEMDLLTTPSGTARPDEIIRLLGLNLLEAGGVLERTILELHDENDSETHIGDNGNPDIATEPGDLVARLPLQKGTT